MEKKFRPIVSRINEYDKPQKTIIKGSRKIVTIIMDVIRSFPQDLRGCWKHKLLKKKANLSGKKGLAALLSFFRVWRTSVNNLYWSKKFCDNYCASYRSVF